MTTYSHQFRAMGTTVHVTVVGKSNEYVEYAQRRIDELESLWSRFIDTSEVSKLNAANGNTCFVSPDTTLLFLLAKRMWQETDGAFDPTVYAHMIRNGYDRTFEKIDDSPLDISNHFVWQSNACLNIEINQNINSVLLPDRIGFDPGGIGKGLAADILAFELVENGASGACVNIGGDIRVIGEPPDANGWIIGIEHPFSGELIDNIAVSIGAVATSWPAVRQWKKGDRHLHHIVDPSTGQPVSAFDAVSVAADEAWRAEAWSKALLVNPVVDVQRLSTEQQFEAMIVHKDGWIETTEGWADLRIPATVN